jgi:4'-phosphopantetheinyl transferase EntD
LVKYLAFTASQTGHGVPQMSVPLNSISELTKAIAEPSILVGHRIITAGDETALLPEEEVYFQNAIAKVRRQSGAARIVARELLERLGFKDMAILKAYSGAPVWPEGAAGSLAHEEHVALAAVARKADYPALGVDIEPVETLPDNLIDIIATPAERCRYAKAFLRGRQLFAAKEAVYKAIYPLDGHFLDFHDIEVDLDAQMARVSYGRTAKVKVLTGSHVIALAFLKSGHSA